MKMSRQLPIVIAGGGIGGLAAALGLARTGCPSVVLERGRRIAEIGPGIQLGPNALQALDELGVGGAARCVSIGIDGLRLMDATDGSEIARIPLDEAFRARFGNGYAVTHRGYLHGTLIWACRATGLVELRTGAEVVGYEQDGATVTAILRGGERVAGRGLIGADGVASTIRSALVGDGAPRVPGHTAYCSVIPTEAMPPDLRCNAATLWAGPGCHVVHYPLPASKGFNLVAVREGGASEPAAGEPATLDEVRQGFEHVGAAARRIVDLGRDWRRWVLCDREPVSTWVDRRVAILGDAAHPMLPYLAQGACMALEDAACLSTAMAHSGDIGRALGAYNRERALRTALVQLQSRSIGRYVYHAAGPHAELRNAVLRAKSPEDWHATLQWLYDGPLPDAGALAAAE